MGDSVIFEPGSVELEEAKAQMQDVSRLWLKRKAEGQDVFVPKPPKRPRQKAYDALLTWDNLLLQYRCRGLEALLTLNPDKTEKDPYDWEFGVVAKDQSSDGKCAYYYCAFFLGLNLEEVDDESHGAWNDTKNAIKDAGLWAHEMLMISAMNAPYGSVMSPVRLEQCRSAMEEYVRVGNWQTDLHFQYRLPRILSDEGRANRVHDPSVAKEVWDDLAKHRIVTNKEDHVSMVRFMQAIYKSRRDDSVWNRKALKFEVICLREGYESTRKVQKLTATAKREAEGPKPLATAFCPARLTMLQGNHEVELVRAAAANQLHIAMQMYGDCSNQLKQRTIVHVADAVADAHSSQNKILRSLDATIPWELEQLGGEGFAPLRKIVALPFDTKALKHLGIADEWTYYDLNAVVAGSAKELELDNQERYALLFDLSMIMVKKRFLRLIPRMLGWPRMFFNLLDVSRQEKTLALLRRHWERFKNTLRDAKGGWKEEVAVRSQFQTKSVQCICLILDKEGWESPLSDRLMGLLRNRGCRLNGTQITEDGIRVCKRALERAKNNISADERLWATLIDERVLSKEHSFAEIDRNFETLDRQADCPSHWFLSQPLLAQKRLDLRGIIRKDAKFNSPGPAMFAGAHVDNYLMDQLEDRGELNLFDKLWLCTLVRQGGIVIRRSATDAWRYIVGEACCSAALGVPCKMVEGVDGIASYFTFDLPAGGHVPVELVAITSLDDMEAIVVEPQAPINVAAKLRAKGQPCAPAIVGGGRLIAAGKCESVLKTCAREAFFKLTLVTLHLLCDLLELTDYHSLGLCDTIVLLVKHILEPTDEELAAILRKRTIRHSNPDLSKLAQLDFVSESMDKDEKDEVKKDIKQQVEEEDLRKEFNRDFDKLKKKLVWGAGRPCSGTTNVKSPFYKMKFPKEIPPEAMTQPQAKEMLPPSCSIWQGKSGNWQAHCPPHKRYWHPWSDGTDHRSACLAAVRDGFEIRSLQVWEEKRLSSHVQMTVYFQGVHSHLSLPKQCYLCTHVLNLQNNTPTNYEKYCAPKPDLDTTNTQSIKTISYQKQHHN
jgi:hypothetical protein